MNANKIFVLGINKLIEQGKFKDLNRFKQMEINLEEPEDKNKPDPTAAIAD